MKRLAQNGERLRETTCRDHRGNYDYRKKCEEIRARNETTSLKNPEESAEPLSVRVELRPIRPRLLLI
jgi:hypothetical protein